MEQSSNTRTIIVKPVSSLCNLRCSYCYNGVESQHRQKLPFMSLDTVDALHNALPEIEERNVRLIWHGGEPLLRGLDFFRAVLGMQGQLLDSHPEMSLENSVMTNGTLITDEWVRFLKDNGWHLGISLDGPACVHDKYRVDANGQGTFERVLRGRRKAEATGMAVGMVAVITSETIRHPPDELYGFWASVSKSIHLSPCWESSGLGMTPEYVVDPNAFLEFVRSAFDLWWQEDNPGTSIRLFKNLVQGALGGRPGNCCFSGSCSQFTAIDADGSVYPCGKFAGIPEFNLGNILTQPLREILKSQAFLDYLRVADSVPTKCAECKWLDVCHNGCTYERYVGAGQFSEVNPFCETWSAAYQYVDARIRETMAAR